MSSSWKRLTIPIVVLLMTLAALSLYGATMARTLVLAHGGTDGAELAVAVHTLGIPHPTGYPTYLLLAQLFRALPWGNLAGRLNLLSACTAALSVGLVALSAAELTSETETPLAPLSAALTAGSILAVAGLFWSQALISEVYSLHTLFLALAFWLLLRWRRLRGKGLLLAGLCLGLGLGNHVSLIFFLPVGGLFCLSQRRRIRPREILIAASLLLLGLGVYLYLPLRAASDPWLNWGNPSSWPAFWAHVSGQSYRGLLFQVPWTQSAARLSATARLLIDDLAPWGLLLGLAGFLLLSREDRPALALTALPAGLGWLLALSYGGVDSQVHLLPLYLAWALWAGVAAGTLASTLEQRRRKELALAVLLLPLLSLALLVRGWPTWSLRDDPGPLPAQFQILEALPPGALLLSDTDEASFVLWYAQVVEGTRPDVSLVDVRLLEWPWYRRQLCSHYPNLPPLPATEEGAWLEILLDGKVGRPAFATAPLPLPANYRLQQEGPIYRIIPPGKTP